MRRRASHLRDRRRRRQRLYQGREPPENLHQLRQYAGLTQTDVEEHLLPHTHHVTPS